MLTYIISFCKNKLEKTWKLLLWRDFFLYSNEDNFRKKSALFLKTCNFNSLDFFVFTSTKCFTQLKKVLSEVVV